MMLVPFADNANHFCVENYFELFNSRLTKKALRKEKNFNNFEKCYFTKTKAKMNFFKHFKEDDEQQKENKVDANGNPTLPTFGCDIPQKKDTDPGKIPFSSLNYYKKVKYRDEIESIDPMEFVNFSKYKDTNIWDLKYISTSDDEDNDSEGDDDIAASDSDEEGEDEQEEMLSEAEQVNKMADKKLFLKNVEGQGEKVPEIVKQLKPTKQKRARVRYQMTYKTENGELVGEEGKRSLVLLYSARC